ncbi:hypothetical protein [Saccharomonospora sp. CUA-673]|uniref:hypothetical protein n=1 Tax=Saccharomonospora sp. CUA-673 TaxID=1904969 RepID=UPI0011150A5F|nr:hypothetical protein [Saccharomonospora sp. CUA-673]
MFLPHRVTAGVVLTAESCSHGVAHVLEQEGLDHATVFALGMDRCHSPASGLPHVEKPETGLGAALDGLEVRRFVPSRRRHRGAPDELVATRPAFSVNDTAVLPGRRGDL